MPTKTEICFVSLNFCTVWSAKWEYDLTYEPEQRQDCWPQRLDKVFLET